MNKIYSIDFMGFIKNELTFCPMNAKDSIMTNFDGSIVNRNNWVFIFASAAVPLIKNEGVKGKQYK